MGNDAKWEYFRVMYERYHKAERKARAALLDEFCVHTRYNRKYAIRLQNGPRPEKERVRRLESRKAAAEEENLWAHPTRSTAEAPHSDKDRRQGRKSAEDSLRLIWYRIRAIRPMGNLLTP